MRSTPALLAAQRKPPVVASSSSVAALIALYRRLDLTPPGVLALPIATGSGMPEHGGVMRRANA